MGITSFGVVLIKAELQKVHPIQVHNLNDHYILREKGPDPFIPMARWLLKDFFWRKAEI